MALATATACGDGGDEISPQLKQGLDEGLATASEQQLAEQLADQVSVPELLAALSALPVTERAAAVRSLSQTQRNALRDHLKKRSSMDASVAGTVNGEPFPAAWLTPDEEPSAPEPSHSGFLQQGDR